MLLFVLTFIMIFGPLLDIGLGALSDIIVGTSLILIFYIFIIKKKKIDKEIKKYTFMVLATLVYSAVTVMLFSLEYPEANASILLRPLKIIITFWGIYALVLIYIHKYPDNYMDKILLNTYYSIGLHGVIMVYQFINPDFRNFIYSFTMAKYGHVSNLAYRMAGLSGGGGSMISTFEGMGVLMLPFVLKIEKFF